MLEKLSFPLWPAPPSMTEDVKCPKHGAMWAYPRPWFLCGCEMPEEEFVRRHNQLKAQGELK